MNSAMKVDWGLELSKAFLGNFEESCYPLSIALDPLDTRIFEKESTQNGEWNNWDWLFL